MPKVVFSMSMQVVSSVNIPNQGSLLNKYSSHQTVVKSDVPVEVKTPVQTEIKPLSSDKSANRKLKIGAFLSTLTGVSVAMACVLKGKGYSLKPSKIWHTAPADWGLFNATYKGHLEMEKLVTKLAFGSVGGGLIGGAIFDKKENMNAKIRESVIQMVGNIFTPLLCVSTVMHLYENKESKIVNYIEKNISKNKSVKCLPKVIVSIGCLVAAIFLGNKVGNTINEKAFHSHDNRKIKLSDMSPHIDDSCLILSMVAANSPIGSVVSRIVPVALMVAGDSVGTIQEKPERLAANAATAQVADNPIKK